MSSEKKSPLTDPASPPQADIMAFSQALMAAYEKAQPVLEQTFQKMADQDVLNKNFDPMNVNSIYGNLVESWLNNPEAFLQRQSDYWTAWYEIWCSSTMRFLGEEIPGAKKIEPQKGDRRFVDEDWQNNALFDFLKQSYLMSCHWIDETIQQTEGLDKHEKDKLTFTARLYANAMSPSNFAMTNPQVIKETIQTGGKNLVKGFENLVNDLERGQGELQISATDYNAFKVGENIAITPGSVIYKNDLIELIQYTPTTDKVNATPLLIIPPWINKYYILDLKPENSLIKWATDQGHSVFVISWVNPDASYAHKSFEDYMQEGILAATKAMQKATGEEQINVIGYCLGGTLLAMTMAYLAQKKQKSPFASVTFLTTLLDFEDAGELKLFLDPAQIAAIDKQLEKTGIFEAKALQQTFKLLRSNDLIWSFVVNNYLMGKEPFPFDLLYWNDDSTNMPATMQSFYLRNMYRDNLLKVPGGISLNGTKIDLSKITTPCYFLSTREDHIAPWQATYQGTQLTSGPCTFTLAASGHIAGVVNPPAKNKYCFWSSNKQAKTPDEWLESAEQSEGSWWSHWHEWVGTYSGDKVPARQIKKALYPAPGEYVKKSAINKG